MSTTTVSLPDPARAWAADRGPSDRVTDALVTTARAHGALAELLGGWSMATDRWFLSDTPVGSVLTSVLTVLAPDDRVLDDVEPMLAAAPGPVALRCRPPRPASESRGWVSIGPQAVLTAPPTQDPEHPEPAGPVTVRRVRDRDGLARALDVLTVVDPVGAEDMDARVLADGGFRWFVADAAGDPAGLLVTTTVDDASVLVGSAVTGADREASLAALLTAWRRDRPYQPTVAVADERSARLAVAAGFARLGEVAVWHRDR